LDIIYIHGIECECVIGVWKWEKAITQKLYIDLDLATDITKSAATDDLNDTLNYKHIADRVVEYAKENQFDLIETLIERLSEVILNEFDVSWLRMKLDKGGVVKNVKNVGIIIERGSKPE